MEGKIFIATTTFTTGVGTFTENVTRVREGHPILSQFPDKFKEADADYEWDVEQASAAPGERRRATIR